MGVTHSALCDIHRREDIPVRQEGCKLHGQLVFDISSIVCMHAAKCGDRATTFSLELTRQMYEVRKERAVEVPILADVRGGQQVAVA